MLSLGASAGARIPHRRNACTSGPVWAATALINQTHLSLAYGNGLFVMSNRTGATSRAYRSADGVNYTAATDVLTGLGSAPRIIHCGTFWYSSINAVFSAISTDADLWTYPAHPSNSGIPRFANGRIYLCDSTGPAHYSVDGNSWTSFTSSLLRCENGMAHGLGLYVAIGTSGASYSADGVTWSNGSTPAWDASINCIIFAAGKFVAVGSAATTDKTYYSTDGVNWSQATFPGSLMNMRQVVYSQGVFLAFGNSSADLIVSTDAITWTRLTGASAFTTSGSFTHMATNGAGLYVVSSETINLVGQVGSC